MRTSNNTQRPGLLFCRWRAPRRRQGAAGRNRERYRLAPSLFALEDRRLLSNFTVTSPLDLDSNGNTVTGTLRWAVAMANSATSPTTITFSPSLGGIITLSKVNDPIVLTNTAEPTTITGPGASLLTVSGNKQTSVLRIAANVTASISGITISNDFDYSAALSDIGSLNLTDCTISGNVGVGNVGGGGYENGGSGLYIKGSATVSDCAFYNNRYGGAICNAGTASFSNCTITGNFALLEGGGVNSLGNTTLTDCTISGNTAQSGSGVYDKGTLSVSGCTITGNGSNAAGSQNGGGV